jgi:hypothetical protein
MQADAPGAASGALIVAHCSQSKVRDAVGQVGHQANQAYSQVRLPLEPYT